MNKIMTALKFFKDHSNQNNHLSQSKKKEKPRDSSNLKRDKENIADKNMSSNKESESRPRTSRGKRAGKVRRKSGASSGGHSALGFHSNLQNHPLLQNLDNHKNAHNRSVNVVPDSPRTKKRKTCKGNSGFLRPKQPVLRLGAGLVCGTERKILPILNLKLGCSFELKRCLANHQKHPSTNLSSINPAKHSSLDAEKLAMLVKGRPKSAKLKKKQAKAADKTKKIAANPHAHQTFLKNGYTSNNFIENSLLMEDSSFDKEDRSLQKYIKNTDSQRKAPTKLKAGEGAKPNKFVSYKKPDKNLSMAYEHFNYIEDLQKMHNNIEEIIRNKGNMKFEAKRKKAVSGNKKKNKRSATPGLSLPQNYMGG